VPVAARLTSPPYPTPQLSALEPRAPDPLACDLQLASAAVSAARLDSASSHPGRAHFSLPRRTCACLCLRPPDCGSPALPQVEHLYSDCRLAVFDQISIRHLVRPPFRHTSESGERFEAGPHLPELTKGQWLDAPYLRKSHEASRCCHGPWAPSTPKVSRSSLAAFYVINLAMLSSFALGSVSGSVDQWSGRRSHGGAEARRKQREEPTTGHKGNWRVPCSCLCVETPVVAHRCFTLPRGHPSCAGA
jgi:hypothetical protein